MSFKVQHDDFEKYTSLYVHIPFCARKCLYCDFTSYSGKETLIDKYSQALSDEIRDIKGGISTIFIGGGTPTYVNTNSMKTIIESINSRKLHSQIEFTIEGNPGSFTADKLKLFKDMGVNRLSIGLQAWQDKILERLGRIHKLEDFKKAYSISRELGFSNINVDLMFGIPGQSFDDWKETLERVVELDVEHISCYSLILEQGTPFYRMYNEGEIELMNECDERDMYHFAVGFLEKNGYLQYEISNFSKKGFECIHNLNYWNLGDYIGCGAGSHSCVGKTRYRRTDSIEEYINQIEEKKLRKLDVHKNSIYDSMEEFMFMGLRKKNGISIFEFQKRFGKDIYSVYKVPIEKHIRYGTLVEKGDRMYLSRRGMDVANSVMCEFILTT